MRDFFTASLIVVTAVLALPVLPLLVLGEGFEDRVSAWFSTTLPPAEFAGMVVAALAADVLIPIPSSFVSTLAGAKLGIGAATLVSWLGMTLGAFGGFALARAGGRPLLARLARPDDVARLEGLAERLGPSLLVATRAVPVLAEASVLLLGTTRLAWKRFAPPVVLANFGIALVYGILGALAMDYAVMAFALVGSIAVPVAATWLARRWLPRAAGER
ncbi:MAG: VTT domain-containing protein [Pirellulales bacterium]|nr:VTT domain-containing protein [Pirellulales bacterium]